MHSAGTTLGMYMIPGNTKKNFIPSFFLILILIQNQIITEGSWDECMKGEFQFHLSFEKKTKNSPQEVLPEICNVMID